MLEDLKYGLRMLRRSPGFAAVVVVTLGLGMGLNTAMFSLLTTFLDLRVPVPDQEQIVNVWSTNIPEGRERSPLSPPDFQDYRRQNEVFADLAAYDFSDYKLTGVNEAQRLAGRRVSESYFRLMGVQPAQGRAFTLQEHQPGGGHVTILSHELWQRRFGGDRNILGRTLLLNGENYTVVGVMPAGHWFPWRYTVDLLTPLDTAADETARPRRTLSVFGRLKPGITLEQAQAGMTAVAQRLEADHRAANRGWGVNLIRLQYEINKRLAMSAFFLFGPVALVLLIACGNVANLLLARAAVRAREVAVRSAMGASRWRLIRQLLTETAWYSLLSAATGLLLAHWGMAATRRFLPPSRADELRLDSSALGFAALMAVVTPLFFGLVPALWASRTDVSTTLNEGGAGARGGVESRRWRERLVVGEVTLAVLLLILGGQLLQFMIMLERAEPGFEMRNLLTASVAMPDSLPAARQAPLWRDILDRSRAIPGVQAAALSDRLPMQGGGSSRPMLLEGCGDAAVAAVGVELAVSPGYLAATHIPLRAGRDFTEQDLTGAAPVALVDETFARRFCGGRDPLGKRLRYEDRKVTPVTIAGVVGDVMPPRRIGPPVAHVYLPYTLKPSPAMSLLVRTAVPPAGLAAAVRDAIRQADAALPVEDVATMEQLLSDEMKGPLQAVAVLAGFAVLALVLAATGVYSVMSYTVSQRTREIGVRRALGARPRQVSRLVVREGMGLVGAGLAAGLMMAGAVEPFAELRGSVASIIFLFCLVSLLLGTVALLACYLPARRASLIEPMAALRHE